MNQSLVLAVRREKKRKEQPFNRRAKKVTVMLNKLLSDKYFFKEKYLWILSCL